MTTFLQLVFGGLALGALYALVALGFVTVFKATGALNFAHGELFVLGAVLAVTFMVNLDWPFALAFVVVAVVMAALGLVLQTAIMRRLTGESLLAIVLATIGVATVIRAIILIAYGPASRGRISGLPRGFIEIAGARLGYLDIIVFGTSLLCVAITFLFFRWTRTGLHMRAVADHFEAAEAMGVRPQWIFAVAWIMGTALAGIGGILYSNYGSSIDLGLAGIGLRAFPAALIGGLDSTGGAIAGGLIVGLSEQLAVGYLGGEWRDVVAFGLVFLVLIARPSGLFGTRQIVRV